MSHSSRGFHSHTIGKTLLFLSVLKSQPPGIPSRKAGSLSSPRPPTPGRGKKKKNPTKKTTLGRDCLPRMDTKCTKELFEAPSKRASPGSGELPGCVGPRWADAGLGRARPFQSSRGGAKRGSPGAPRTQNKRPGRNAAPGRSPAPPALILRMGPLAGVFRGPEMQFSTPGKVTSAGARLGVGEGRAGGGGADPSSQRGPRPAGSPPLTLGLRLHPSPPAAREGGWPVAKGELAGLLRGWGPTGGRQGRGKGARDKKKKKKHSRAAECSEETCVPTPPAPSGAGSRGNSVSLHASRPPKAKVAGMHRGSPLPWANPTTSLLPAPLEPGPRGGGELPPEEERSAPLWRGQTRAGSAAPPSARPSPPRSGSWPIKSPNYAWAWSPLGPPAPGRHNQRARRAWVGKAGETWRMVSWPRAPGRRLERPRASRQDPLPGGDQGRPKAAEQLLGTSGGTVAGGVGGSAPTAEEAPGAITELPECPPVSVRGPGGAGCRAPPPELCITRLGKGHYAPGLGSEGRLMDPNLGAPGGGA